MGDGGERVPDLDFPGGDFRGSMNDTGPRERPAQAIGVYEQRADGINERGFAAVVRPGHHRKPFEVN
jgi:hypothetical protein